MFFSYLLYTSILPIVFLFSMQKAWKVKSVIIKKKFVCYKFPRTKRIISGHCRALKFCMRVRGHPKLLTMSAASFCLQTNKADVIAESWNEREAEVIILFSAWFWQILKMLKNIVFMWNFRIWSHSMTYTSFPNLRWTG